MDTASFIGDIAKIVSGSGELRLSQVRRLPGGSSFKTCQSYGGENWKALVRETDYITALENGLELSIASLFREWDEDVFSSLWQALEQRQSTPMLLVCLAALGDRVESFFDSLTQKQRDRIQFLIGLCKADPDLRSFLM